MKHLLANQARIFQTIIEAGSITRAAERLDMGKSSVSDALKHLEASLGTQLLIRTTRRQSLTNIGEQFYHRCRELNDLSTVTLEEVNEHLAEPIGSIRITAPHATIENCVAPAIAELLSKYPRLEPELIIDDKRLDLISENIDVALTVGELPDSEFKAQRVGVLKDVLCASPKFYEAHSLASGGDLPTGLPYVAHHWERSNIEHCLVSKTNGNKAIFPFQRVATANSINAVLALILNGVGVGTLPHFFLKPMLAKGELVKLLPDYEPRQTNIYAIHPYGSNPPLAVREAITTMKQKLMDEY